jgi:putative oxygen-independent coproporphyrinogen III oxidase
MATLTLTPASHPHFTALPPLGLYVHMPWCVRKCPYCDFNSHEARGGVPEQQYIDALMADLEQALPLIWGREVYTVFFGGGTPSLFSAEGMDTILSGLRARLRLHPFAEITMEANPGTFEAEKFREFRAAGINRLSIGIQSFNPAHLKALGRIHDDRQARAAVEIAQASFDNFNLDLMYALPGQTVDDALADIRQAIAFAPKHLSAYQLTLEPNTYFHNFPPKLPDEDTSAAIQDALQAELAAHGYQHYETSAYAQAGFQCRHNLNYWMFGDYLGIGAGAHGKISLPDRIVRQAKHRHPQAYMEKALQGNAIQREHDVAVKDLGFEFMMNALRLADGFEVSLFQERTGLPITLIERPLREAEEKGLIERDFLRIRPTELGQRFLNDLLELFLPQA